MYRLPNCLLPPVGPSTCEAASAGLVQSVFACLWRRCAIEQKASLRFVFKVAGRQLGSSPATNLDITDEPAGSAPSMVDSEGYGASQVLVFLCLHHSQEPCSSFFLLRIICLRLRHLFLSGPAGHHNNGGTAESHHNAGSTTCTCSRPLRRLTAREACQISFALFSLRTFAFCDKAQ